jgi:hypothetical protein
VVKTTNKIMRVLMFIDISRVGEDT